MEMVLVAGLAVLALMATAAVVGTLVRAALWILFLPFRVVGWLLFLPLLLKHEWRDPQKLGLVSLAFIAFSLAASSAYVLNDLHEQRLLNDDERLYRDRHVAAGGGVRSLCTKTEHRHRPDGETR